MSGHSERVARAPKGRALSCREEIKNEFVTREQRQSGNVRQEAEEPRCWWTFSKKPDARQLVPRGSEQQGATAQPVCFRRLSKRNGELRYRRPLYSKYVMLQPRARKRNVTMEREKWQILPISTFADLRFCLSPQRQQKDIFIKALVFKKALTSHPQ